MAASTKAPQPFTLTSASTSMLTFALFIAASALFSPNSGGSSPLFVNAFAVAPSPPRARAAFLGSSLPSSSSSTALASSSVSSSSSESSIIVNRAAEVATVAVLDVAVPLIASAVGFARSPPTTTAAASEDGSAVRRGWDAFWSLSSSSSSSSTSGKVTNAERVASAMEQLGPTYVKFGQALSSRPDIVPPSLAGALSKLQDDMQSFDTTTAKDIILDELCNRNDQDGQKSAEFDDATIRQLVDSLSEEPIAAASVGQVYKGNLPGYGDVAVKVQRPGVRKMVESDAALLRRVAMLIESIPALPAIGGSAGSSSSSEEESVGGDDEPKQDRLIATELVKAIDEFMGRLFEELDYGREAKNAANFAELYSIRGGTAVGTMPDVNGRGVVVPEFLHDLCTDNVLVMEWIEGTKLTEVSKVAGASREDERVLRENLSLIELATKCTLSQLLDTGVLHADPHGGNLLKVKVNDGVGGDDDSDGQARFRLAYLDFGIVSFVPAQVRDGLVCAVAQLIFARNVDAVASLFGELQLIPPEVMNDPVERSALQVAMGRTMDEALRYPDEDSEDETSVPVLLFDKLLDSLARLVPRFQFDLPPYFINNARALSTLEGIARTLDPSFNVLQVMYPYALNRMLQNPTGSPVVEETLQSLIRSEATGRVDRNKVSKLLRDSALITGFKKRRILWDVLKTSGGRRIVLGITAEEMNQRLVQRWFKGSSSARQQGRRKGSVSDYLKL